jgi:thioredoxin-dependent peroxiredoxin
MLKKFVAKAVKKLEIGLQKHQTSLKVGDTAPIIHGLLQDGKSFDSETIKGKKTVIYFYPEDGTAGCTAQACSLRDNYQYMLKAGYAVIGVSADSVQKHKDFANKYNLPFPLIADEKMELIKAFDVWGKKQFLGKEFDGIIRTTFVIDENGMISEIISEVDTVDHAKQILGS